MQEKNISKNNFEQCLKCTICTVYCPVVPVNPSYPGPKQAGPDGERYRLKKGIFYDDSLKYCLNCKRCEVACPSGVRVGDIIQSAKLSRANVPSMAGAMLASTDLVGSVATKVSGITNSVLASKPVKAVLHSVLGVDKHRTFPKYTDETFEKWFATQAEPSQNGFKKQISYFHGCYANFNYPQLGKDFVTLMNALGYGVRLLDNEQCCGVAMIANGMKRSATSKARKNVATISKAVEQGREVVTVSTSCTMTLRDEYPHVLGVDNSAVRDHIVLVEKFLYKLLTDEKVKLVFKKGYKAKVAYHCPCHQEKLGWGAFTVDLLSRIPGVELQVLDSNCCGIAGTYGFKKANYEASQAIGKPLFDQIAATNPDYVACECETCKWQIEMSTGYSVKNPVSILVEALDLQATAALNR